MKTGHWHLKLSRFGAGLKVAKEMYVTLNEHCSDNVQRWVTFVAQCLNVVTNGI